MKYKDAITISMEHLAQNPDRRFLGYNVKFGSQAYGTLKSVQGKCIETPLAENLMVSLAAGMSIEGFKPVVFFERQDFLLNGLDCIVNHLGKIDSMSEGQYKTPVIIRAAVGSKTPLNPGPQHTQNFTEAIRLMVKFPVIDLRTSSQILEEYRKASSSDCPVIFVERKDLYEQDF